MHWASHWGDPRLAIVMTTVLATALAGPASALTGFGTGFGFIVAIGPQNAWVLRQGVRREHIGLVIAICALSDLILIATGTGSVGVLAGAAPWALEALRWGGVAYLLAFALSSFRSALRPGALGETTARLRASAKGALVKEGRRFEMGETPMAINSWIAALGI